MGDDHENHGHTDRIAYGIAHANHGGLHSLLFILMIAILIGSQIALFLWKKHYYRSFQRVTLFGLWLVPFLLSLALGFWRMIFIWTVFTAITLHVLRIASQTPVEKSTPRTVYGWFYLLYRVSYPASIAGYVLLMLEFSGIARVIPLWLTFNSPLIYIGSMLLFYGLYYGVLGRDCAEMCTDRLATKMGFTGKGLPAKTLPANTCCICGEKYETQDAIALNCTHMFHEWCIRGWSMIGKKDTCPYCSEKVQMNKIFKNPWEKQGIMWAHLLDSLRYLIVWNPIILTAVQLMIYFIDPGA